MEIIATVNTVIMSINVNYNTIIFLTYNHTESFEINNKKTIIF